MSLYQERQTVGYLATEVHDTSLAIGNIREFFLVFGGTGLSQTYSCCLILTKKNLIFNLNVPRICISHVIQ